MNNPLNKEIYQKRSHHRQPDVRGDYFRDQTAIIHSLPFRRLKHKTQVFISPESDHICTRIEHVLHVATIAASICKGLNNNGWNLDADMAYAIGLGHDLGHAPFGHTGESALNKILGGGNAFIHEVNSYRVVEYLAKYGNGLNLTYGVKDGIICHNGERFEQSLKPNNTINILDEIQDRSALPSSYEGCIMRFSDKIAYLGRDIEDAILSQWIKVEDVPKEIKTRIGSRNGDIIDAFVMDIINTSKESNAISFSDEMFELLLILKEFNYKNIYNNSLNDEYINKGHEIVFGVFDYLFKKFHEFSYDHNAYAHSELKIEKAFGRYLYIMKDFYLKENKHPSQPIIDYVSGMTDKFAIDCYEQLKK